MQLEPPNSTQPYAALHADSASVRLSDLDAAEVQALYCEHGAILFRGFVFSVPDFKAFTDRFCSDYVANESPGRDVVSQDGRVQTVNLGQKRFALHPEMAREPWQPHIAWFACQQPAEAAGETILCDGIEAVKTMPQELVDHLANNSLAHTQPTTLEWCRHYFKDEDISLDQLLSNSIAGPFLFSLLSGQLYRTYVRPLLHKPMFSDQRAYGNFLVFARRNVGDPRFPTYADGSIVPESVVDAITSATDKLEHKLAWRQGDLLMLDNTRFMHGREPIGGDPTVRRILTQFGSVAFAPSSYCTPGTERGA